MNFVLVVCTEKAHALKWTPLSTGRKGMEEMTKTYKKDTYGLKKKRQYWETEEKMGRGLQ